MHSASSDGHAPSSPRRVDPEYALIRAFEPLVQARAKAFARTLGRRWLDDLAQEGRLAVLDAVRALGPTQVLQTLVTDDARSRRTRAYIARAVRNRLLDFVQKEQALPEVLPDEPLDAADRLDRFTPPGLIFDVREALALLTRKQAEALDALTARELPLREAATFLKVSVAALRERRDRANVKLRLRLSAYAN